MDIPQQYREYPCHDYFAGEWFERGHFDERSQTLVIVPLANAYEDKNSGFFSIGRSGFGGIDFGYRKGFSGLWAYYPIDQDFKLMANSVAELVEGWCSNKLSV